jgi:hypothetical protein
MGNGDPNSISRIIAGLTILARYGADATTGAEHDVLSCRLARGATDEDAAALRALGWFVEYEPDCIWSFYV